MTPTPTFDSDHHPAEALSRAERRLAMLQGLAEMGLALAKDICVRSMDSPYHPELKHDPGRAFAAAARAVRLTMVLEMRVEKEIVALRNGDVVVTPAQVGRPMDAGAPAEPTHSSPERRRPASSSSASEASDSDRRDRETDGLGEDECDEFDLDGDFDACVGAVRAGLGLALRTGERGADVCVPSGVADDPDFAAPARATRRRFFPPPRWGGYTQAFRLEPSEDETIIPGAGDFRDNPAPDFAEAPSRPSP